MFAKRAKPSSQPSPPVHGGQIAESGVDSRDEQIEGLERELTEQRAAAKSLREALDAATFKVEILEKSYATQLAEVRDKRAALEAGCKIAIDTDAHKEADFDHLPYGILTARRAAMRPERCINTWSAERLHAWLRSKR